MLTQWYLKQGEYSLAGAQSVCAASLQQSEKVPVTPQEVLLLLSDFRQRVFVTHLSKLLVVALSQGIVSRQSVTLKNHITRTLITKLGLFYVFINGMWHLEVNEMTLTTVTTSSSYQTGVTVIKAELSGYVPVSVLLNDAHVRELDRTTEMVKLQLQAGSFLCGKRWEVVKVITERCPCQ